MESLIYRLLLVGTVTIIALHFPELICWHYLHGRDLTQDNPRLLKYHALLRKILRITFFYYIILLGYALYNSVPSPFLVFPLVLFHLAGLIIGERDLITEIPVNQKLYLFVSFLIFTNLLEMGFLTVIVLQMRGVVTL